MTSYFNSDFAYLYSLPHLEDIVGCFGSLSGKDRKQLMGCIKKYGRRGTVSHARARGHRELGQYSLHAVCDTSSDSLTVARGQEQKLYFWATFMPQFLLSFHVLLFATLMSPYFFPLLFCSPISLPPYTSCSLMALVLHGFCSQPVLCLSRPGPLCILLSC